MRNQIYNSLLLFLIFNIFCLILYRTFCEKLPRNLLLFTGIFLFFFFLRISSKYIITSLIYTYKKIRNLNIEDRGKIAEFFYKKAANVEIFLEKEFKTNFLYKNKIISYLSLFCLKIYEKKQESFFSFFKIFFVLPWLITFGIYFFEVFYYGDLYFSLYLFPLNLLIRKCFYDLFLSTIRYETKRIFDSYLEYHFPIFFKGGNLKEFFLVNPLIRSQFLFHQPRLQNKEDLLVFWEIFNNIIFYNIFFRAITNFDRPFCFFFKNFSLKINGTLFTTTFFIIFWSKLFNIPEKPFYDLFLVSVIFVCCFIILLLFLDFLFFFEEEENNTDYTSYFVTVDNLKDFYANSLIKDKEYLLKKYNFLTASDLNFSSGYDNIQKLHLLRNSPISSKMSLETFEFSLTLEKKFLVWFANSFKQGFIRMSSFSCFQTRRRRGKRKIRRKKNLIKTMFLFFTYPIYRLIKRILRN